MTRPRVPKVELTQTRDLSGDLLRGFAEVYAEALEMRRQGRALAERWCDLMFELDRAIEGESEDDHPIWVHSGAFPANRAVQLVSDTIESILLCRVGIGGGHSCPCECNMPPPEWPATAAPLPGDFTIQRNRSA